jgi:hypothetical protein
MNLIHSWVMTNKWHARFESWLSATFRCPLIMSFWSSDSILKGHGWFHSGGSHANSFLLPSISPCFTTSHLLHWFPVFSHIHHDAKLVFQDASLTPLKIPSGSLLPTYSALAALLPHHLWGFKTLYARQMPWPCQMCLTRLRQHLYFEISSWF